MLRKVCLLLPFVISACTTEDPGIDKTQFPSAMAAAACSWAFTCCDAAEVKTLTTGSTEAACTAELTTTYNNLYANANPAAWSPKDARQVVLDVQAAAASCPRGFDPTSTLNGHQPVFPSKGPGDLCNNTFECSTHFCNKGTCANPLPAGSTCSATDPCASSNRCINGVCKALQMDGSSCTDSVECYSGACGGGKCLSNTDTYRCDKK